MIGTLRLWAIVFSVLVSSTATAQQATTSDGVSEAKLGKTRNVHVYQQVYLSGQPTAEDFDIIKDKGIQRIITLSADSEVEWDEKAAAEKADLEFLAIPVASPEALSNDVLDQLRALLRDADEPILLHCASGSRVGAVWLAHRVLDEGLTLEAADAEARMIGLRSASLRTRALEYIRLRSKEVSVKPGINAGFLNSEMSVDEWVKRFEAESREVFLGRRDILKAIGLGAGDRVADVGAGTGFYSKLFAKAVGKDGWVFAVDISPRFVEHLRQQAQQDGVKNLTATLCQEDTISLPPASVDVVFICDTYHHFEYPQSTLASILRALKPGGTLILIDFERIPGKTREFLINHVRAGKEVFRGEIETAGFDFVEQVRIDSFRENYFLRFKKPE